MSWKDSIKAAVNHGLLECEKYSPQILFAVGCVGVAGAIVMTVKQSTKADSLIRFHKGQLMTLNKLVEDGEEDVQPAKAKAMVFLDTSVEMAKIMAPPIALAAGSIACFAASNHIINQRYLGAVAWGNALADSFAVYRSRVKEEIGEEADRHFRYGTGIKVEKSKFVDENGNVTTETCFNDDGEDTPIEDLRPSEYAKYFDSSNDNWDPNPSFNLMFLRAQEKLANDKFHADGHLFLNEVYDMLGFHHTPVGAVVGWVKGIGDDFVDFGLGNKGSDSVRSFINGNRSVVPLDFNVCGVIWDKI